jgi:hypothetical protein
VVRRKHFARAAEDSKLAASCTPRWSRDNAAERATAGTIASRSHHKRIFSLRPRYPSVSCNRRSARISTRFASSMQCSQVAAVIRRQSRWLPSDRRNATQKSGFAASEPSCFVSTSTGFLCCLESRVHSVGLLRCRSATGFQCIECLA